MFKLVDSFLNRITMYRLGRYYLIALLIMACVLGMTGHLPFTLYDILISSTIAVVVGYIANLAFARLFKATTSFDSMVITTMIILLIMPIKFPADSGVLILAVVLAMASKYLVTIDKRHLLNPAAAGVVAVALLFPDHVATWWVGTPFMLPAVVVGGLLLMRKVRREDMIVTFLLTDLALVAVATLLHRSGSLSAVLVSWRSITIHTALLFFGFVMLTEPLTSPPTRDKRRWYAALVALLYATPQLRLFGYVATPELALLYGNIFSYFVSPKYRLLLPLGQKVQLTRDTYAFVFNRPDKMTFTPGQYLEWTLQHENEDNRGSRRYFSLASSPTERQLMIVVKFYNPSSTYKQALLKLPSGQAILASGLAGDFVIPKKVKEPMVFIAGGVGIAPFRSMIQYIIDKKIQTNIVLLFSNRTAQDVVFSKTFATAQQFGVKTVYTLTDTQTVPQGWPGKVGTINAQMIQAEVPDWQSRRYYISGPQPMVQSYEQLLHSMGVHRKRIVTDYFPGYTE